MAATVTAHRDRQGDGRGGLILSDKLEDDTCRGRRSND